ncbi:MAG TPA: PstS family phosphate ABC transporter substrate-binding protein [Longimicrobiales bacterium]|nr:PstS family phosphate ABC transporter substrate-binding protein [Longimicrobiales bacterium]
MRNTVVVLLGVAVLAACGNSGQAGEGRLAGSIEIDGSSTVYPITEAVAEEFGAATGGDVRVMVGFSGTGGGFRRFCNGETVISNASRHISETEAELCAANGVEYVEMQVAIDGLAVVVNPQNDFVQCLAVEELRRMWEPGSQVTNWSQVRDGFPNQPVRLYGPGTNSGTFDYFTHAIVGEERASRTDFTASEDDNVLVQGVEGDRNALGYFGYAYYHENQGRLRAVAIDNGQGCVEATPATVASGEYAPLARPIFIYVRRDALERPEVAEFVRFYNEHAAELAREVGYVAAPQAAYDANMREIGQGGTR